MNILTTERNNEISNEAVNSFFLKIIYDNTSDQLKYKGDWGFSCLINDSILFDTGKSFNILHHNIKMFGIDAGNIQHIIISHNHSDHSGGLEGILKLVGSKVSIYGSNDFIRNFRSNHKGKVIDLVLVDKSMKVSDGIYLSEPLTFDYKGKKMEEISLVLTNKSNISIITGCAHPGLLNIIKNVKSAFPDKQMDLVLGGFHLMNTSESDLIVLLNQLKKLGVLRVAPMHCTGQIAIDIFRKNFKRNFLKGGAGMEINF